MRSAEMLAYPLGESLQRGRLISAAIKRQRERPASSWLFSLRGNERPGLRRSMPTDEITRKSHRCTGGRRICNCHRSKLVPCVLPNTVYRWKRPVHIKLRRPGTLTGGTHPYLCTFVFDDSIPRRSFHPPGQVCTNYCCLCVKGAEDPILGESVVLIVGYPAFRCFNAENRPELPKVCL